MADKAATALTAASAFAASDLLYGVEGANSRKFSRAVIAAGIAAVLAVSTLQPAAALTDPAPMTLAQTWNDAADTFTGLKVAVTDTASAAASKLLDLQVGGVSKFAVSKAGGAVIDSAASLAWSTDLFLFRDAANVLALRSSTNAQAFRIYNTTDAGNVNFERLGIRWTSNVLVIGAEQGGTGTQRVVRIDGSDVGFRIAGATKWNIDSSGNILAGSHNNNDIGAPGAMPRSLFLGSNLAVAGVSGFGGASSATTYANLGAGTTGISPLRFVQGVAPTSPVDGDMWREDNTNTGLKVRINGVTKTVSVV